MTAGLVIKIIKTLWKVLKALIHGAGNKLKIKPKAIFTWLIDVIKESIAQIFTLSDFSSLIY